MKSRFLSTPFSAVLLSLFLSAVVYAQTKSNTWLNGVWEGTGYQTDDRSTWTMLVTARGGRFSIDYSSLNCGGRWQLINLFAYLSKENHDRLTLGYEEVGKMLSGMISQPERFAPRS